MKINKIIIENYRIFENIEIDIENDLTLIIGKNNTGKTSIISILKKCLCLNPEFTIDDFNRKFFEKLESEFKSNNLNVQENNYVVQGIRLKLFILYDETDNLEILGEVMMDLDPNNNIVVLGYDYVLNFDAYKALCEDFINRKNENDDLFCFIRYDLKKYFCGNYKTFQYDYIKKLTGNAQEIAAPQIQKIINFQDVSAKREVNNSESNSTLSKQTAKLYESIKSNLQNANNQKEFQKLFDDLQEQLQTTDGNLKQLYQGLFKDILIDIENFGGIGTTIKISSTLQEHHEKRLDNNTRIEYQEGNYNLPEYQNGLGYMNLLSIIFQIYQILDLFKNKGSAINILFIEEPEAHMHPQMQKIFIKNIQGFLKEKTRNNEYDGTVVNLQYIVSSHSAHIVSECDSFEAIKYLIKSKNSSIEIKNLSDLKTAYGNQEEPIYKFLKQYLTLNASELFFADKAIFIEGDTERILLPAMFKKVDEDNTASNNHALRSQNISILSIGGRYFDKFEKFIDFLQIKCLIITDIDSVQKDGKSTCQPKDDKAVIGNPGLLYFFNEEMKNNISVSEFVNDDYKDSVRQKTTTGRWETCCSQQDGKFYIAFQHQEFDYLARSFEDSFVSVNKEFIKQHYKCFSSVSNMSNQDIDNILENPYEFVVGKIDSKTAFALDIIYYSNERFNNWNIPEYIRKGLEWLRQD